MLIYHHYITLHYVVVMTEIYVFCPNFEFWLTVNVKLYYICHNFVYILTR